MGGDDVLADGMELGYIWLWRKIKNSAILRDPHLLQLWIWILVKAAWGPRTVSIVTGRGRTLVHLQPGQFVFGRKSASEETGQPAETLRDRMKRLKNLGMITIKPATHYSVVAVVNWASYQGKAGKDANQPADQPATQPPPKRHKEEVKALKKDQNTSPSADAEEPPSDRGNGKDAGGVQALFDLWNSEAKSLPKATKLTEGRKRKILARLRERSLEEWGEVFRGMERSSFLRGESGGSFRADLDWIIANEGNALKVIEGRYDDREKRPVSSPMRDVTGRIL